MAKNLKKVKSGDPITAEMWNDLVDWCMRARFVNSQSSGLQAQETPSGTLVTLAPAWTPCLAIADGNITARSGSTCGTGSVKLVDIDDPTLTTTSDSYDVLNPSANTMTSGNGIDSGQYCWVVEYPSGVLLVAPLECS